jgi:TPP-dependent trihydroxycyclohexane-1,2-dione (THcHDO) dehydratase
LKEVPGSTKRLPAELAVAAPVLRSKVPTLLIELPVSINREPDPVESMVEMLMSPLVKSEDDPEVKDI